MSTSDFVMPFFLAFRIEVDRRSLNSDAVITVLCPQVKYPLERLWKYYLYRLGE
jgi:hypothetical protein